MKKILPLIFIALTAIIFVGCGEDKNSAPFIKVGMLQHLNVVEKEFNSFMKKIDDILGTSSTSHEVIYFKNLTSMQMALESGQIQEISTYKCVADYLINRNPKIEIINEHTQKFIDTFCFAVRAEDTDLKNSLNEIIEEMRADGTLGKIRKEYINVNENPASVEFGNFGDAETLKIGITGDLPPLDLILADGTPAGFNTALISEIGKRLQKNIEIIHVDSASRATALSSGKVDIIFWVILPLSEIFPENMDKPDGIELTSPYYRDKIVHLEIKK